VQTIVEESMENAFNKIIPDVPFAVEIRMAETWG
jgi:DNA polymerase I-like protein with 3'-5' exonuclease and polymerase domains